VACIALAVIITIATQRGNTGISSVDPDAIVWLKCRNPKCENTWQMNKREYFEYCEKHRRGMTVPPIPCPKCGEETGYRAEKCEKCGLIFERGSVPNAIADKCPKCGFSRIESIGATPGGDKAEAPGDNKEE
jgi:predicted RNA-binding Zn-ribbon protein involved in translation (DUF1610 family)